MESICCKAWEVQSEKPTVVVTCYFCLLCLYFPFFLLETHLNFLTHFSTYSLHEDCNPWLGGRPVTQNRPISINLGNFVRAFRKMENVGLLAVRFVNLAFRGPPYRELLKNGAFAKEWSRPNRWEERLNSNTIMWAPGIFSYTS